MELPSYHSPEVEKYVDAVTSAIETRRVELASVLRDVSPEMAALADDMEALAGKWNPVELYTAGNFKEERATFLGAFKEGRSYVPVFRYPRAEAFDAEGARAKLKEFRLRASSLPIISDRDRLARLTLLAKIDDDLASCDMAQGMALRDDELVKRGCAAKYPGLDDDLLRCAEIMFNDIADATDAAVVEGELSNDDAEYLEKTLLSPEEEADAYRWALEEYGMLREGDDGEGFRVVIDKGTTALDVRDKSAMGPTVFVPEHRDERLSAMEVCALIAHEIEGHARQAMNGKKLFRLGGEGLRKDDETLYEGLAIRYEWEFVEKYFGKVRYDLDHNTLYIFAVHMARAGASFEEIFRDQLERCRLLSLSPASSICGRDEEYCRMKAFRMTYRVMRGHTDATNKQSFAMEKDLAYLRGWLMDQRLIESGLGHANETAIMSPAGLQSLATMSITPDDVPIKFKDVAPVYMRKLLDKREKSLS